MVILHGFTVYGRSWVEVSLFAFVSNLHSPALLAFCFILCMDVCVSACTANNKNGTRNEEPRNWQAITQAIPTKYLEDSSETWKRVKLSRKKSKDHQSVRHLIMWIFTQNYRVQFYSPPSEGVNLSTLCGVYTWSSFDNQSCSRCRVWFVSL